jgi:2-polyprenyl-3-methyl-5-hydroxy-6-metoxy-1,4-benzoquinol methylase
MKCELCKFDGPMKPWFMKHGIVKCPNCDLIFYSENQGSTENLYSESYFKGGEYHDYIEDKKVIQANFQKRIDDLKKLKTNGRLLEIGCAYGFFLDLARKHWEVKGIDVSPEGVKHAKENLGLDAEQGDFLSMPDDSHGFDIICMWDTVEHLSQPVRFIEKASRWLKPGGILVMTTGDIESRVAKFRKDKWRQIHPPTHLYYFSRNTLKKAVQNASLVPKSVSYVGYTRRYKTMAHNVFCLKSNKPAIYNLFTLGGKLDFPVYLNLKDIMMMVAQKPAKAY